MKKVIFFLFFVTTFTYGMYYNYFSIDFDENFSSKIANALKREEDLAGILRKKHTEYCVRYEGINSFYWLADALLEVKFNVNPRSGKEHANLENFYNFASDLFSKGRESFRKKNIPFGKDRFPFPKRPIFYSDRWKRDTFVGLSLIGLLLGVGEAFIGAKIWFSRQKLRVRATKVFSLVVSSALFTLGVSYLGVRHMDRCKSYKKDASNFKIYYEDFPGCYYYFKTEANSLKPVFDCSIREKENDKLKLLDVVIKTEF